MHRIVLNLCWYLLLGWLSVTPVTATSTGLFFTDTLADSPIPVEQAYQFTAEVVTPEQLRLIWTIADGTYLYKEQVKVTLDSAQNVELVPITWPVGIIKRNAVRPDGEIGDLAVYHGNIELYVGLKRTTKTPMSIVLTVKYQGCAEIGICYPPITKQIHLNLPAITDMTTMPEVRTTPLKPAIAAQPLLLPTANTLNALATGLQQGNMLWIVSTFFGLGLLLAFTPCVFPMVPILSGIIVGQGKDLTSGRAFLLSLVYVLAMAFTYTITGIVAGLFGHNLQIVFQNQWIIAGFAILFVALALAMFDLYALQLPTALQTRITTLSNNQSGGSLLGVAIMGLLSALIVGPCIAPPLAGTLIYISQTGNAVIGGVALFALSMGMGAPLLVIGASAGQLLPKAGPWMDAIKFAFGVMLLGVAITFLERILPPFTIMLMWGTLFICTAMYMGALRTHPHDAPNGWHTLWQGLGIVLLVYGTLLLIGASAGRGDVFRPLQGVLIGNSEDSIRALAFRPIKTVAELDAALAEAKAQSRPVVLDFSADWCVSCKELERDTLLDPKVQTALQDFMLLRVDVTANDGASQTLQTKFGLVGPPAILFYNRAGEELSPLRVIGFVAATEFIAHLQQVIQ